MKRYKLIITYKRGDALYLEEESISPYYLEIKAMEITLFNKDLQYKIYEL